MEHSRYLRAIVDILTFEALTAESEYSWARIEFDDVIESCGWEPANFDERRWMHAKIWEAVRVGEKQFPDGCGTFNAWCVGARQCPVDRIAHGDAPVMVEVLVTRLGRQLLSEGLLLGELEKLHA